MESRRIADQLRRSLHGEAWHGPSVMELLAGVTAAQAAARPVAGAHTIWEIVLHINAWLDAVRRRVEGEALELTPAQDWPAPGAGDAAWEQAVKALEENGRRLGELAAGLSDEQLKATAPGTDYSVYFMLHGVVQHNLYHAGQIALLKKRV